MITEPTGTRSGRRMMTGVAALVLALSVAACSSSGGGTKAGTPTEPTVLRVATDDTADKPTAAMITTFAAEVAQRSGGSLRVEPAYAAAGEPEDDWDQKVAGRVTSGELEMGLIPSRAWDTEGVTSLRALNAPFLVTNDTLLNDVVSSELAGPLMAGLSPLGVTGLALFPEELRHPFSFGKPLLGPADYQDGLLRAPESATVTSIFAALGADTTDAEINPQDQAGMESSYGRAHEATATGNVTFFPKVEVLVINDAVLASLDEGQRSVLQEAATAARDTIIASSVPDAQQAQTFCAAGGVIALADPEQLDALQKAAAPVLTSLEQDPTTKDLIAKIQAMKSTTPDGPTVQACGNTKAVAPTPSATGDVSQVNGVYRFEVTDAQFAAVGVTDPVLVDENHGVFTWTLKDGRWCWEQKADNVLNNPDDCGPYVLKDDKIYFTYTDGSSETFTWTKTENGDLTLAPVKVIDAASGPIMFVNRWVRVGDAP